MSEANKELAQLWFEEVWNKGRRAAIGSEIVAPVDRCSPSTKHSTLVLIRFERDTTMYRAFCRTRIAITALVLESRRKSCAPRNGAHNAVD